MHPALAGRVISGHAQSWARCPRFVLAELSTSVSLAGLSTSAMLMALEMIIAGLPGSKSPFGWETSPPAPCEQWRDVPVQMWPSPLPWTPVPASGIGSEQRQPGGSVPVAWNEGVPPLCHNKRCGATLCCPPSCASALPRVYPEPQTVGCQISQIQVDILPSLPRGCPQPGPPLLHPSADASHVLPP